MKILLHLLFFGSDSGVTAPLSANDNLNYNPSIHVRSSLFLRISEILCYLRVTDMLLCNSVLVQFQ